MICPGSLNAEKDLPNTTSKYADEGTFLHDEVNKVITGRITQVDHLSADHQEGVDLAAAYYFELKNGGEVIKELHERAFSLDFIFSGMKGTVDSLLITFTDSDNTYDLHIIDFKFGKGVLVNAYKNYQLLMYYLGAVNDPEVVQLLAGKTYNIHLHIVQPYKVNTTWTLTSEERVFYNDLKMYKDVVKECNLPDAPRVASVKACQFCKAKPTCKTLATYVPTVQVDLNSLTDSEIADIYDKKDLITMYVKSVEEFLKSRLEQGAFLNYTLKPKLTNRKWDMSAQEYLTQHLGEAAFDVSTKLIGITKAEKILGKNIVDNLTIREVGNNEIVKLNTEPYHEYFYN
jgi:hypothetical protein